MQVPKKTLPSREQSCLWRKRILPLLRRNFLASLTLKINAIMVIAHDCMWPSSTASHLFNGLLVFKVDRFFLLHRGMCVWLTNRAFASNTYSSTKVTVANHGRGENAQKHFQIGYAAELHVKKVSVELFQQLI